MAGLVPAIATEALLPVRCVGHLSAMAGAWVYIMTNRPTAFVYRLDGALRAASGTCEGLAASLSGLRCKRVFLTACRSSDRVRVDDMSLIGAEGERVGCLQSRVLLIVELDLTQCGPRLRYCFFISGLTPLAVSRTGSTVFKHKVDDKIIAADQPWYPRKEEGSEVSEAHAVAGIQLWLLRPSPEVRVLSLCSSSSTTYPKRKCLLTSL